MGLVDLFGCHLLYHFLLGNGRVGVAADRGEDVPHIGPHQVRRGHAPTDLIIPANAGLGTGMTLHRRTQIPLEGAHVVLQDPQTARIHHPDQFLGLGIARDGRRQQFVHGGGIFARIHQIARGFNLGMGRAENAKPKRESRGKGKGNIFHLFSSLIALAVAPAYASGLPEPMQASDFENFDPELARIGQLLFFDPILSGNRNISCATCHHPDHGSSDGLSLGIGEGGAGVGPDRTPGEGAARIRKRIPRNAPALWNLGAREVTVLFHDGRISVSDIYDNGFNTPAQEWLPAGLDGILAVQALFPLTSQFEMAGDPRENQVAGAAYDRIDAVWPILAKRVRVIPEYSEMFVAAFDDVTSPLDIDITHIANAIAAFEGTEFQSFDSPFDVYIGGDDTALLPDQLAGLQLFYGKAGCSTCHSGPLLTDHRFHALMLPHFGPGRTRQWDTVVRDVGRMGVSDRIEDAYRFRTPSLRNVALTAPYGHNGAYPTLEGMVRHHLNPQKGFALWQKELAALPQVPWLSKADFLPFEDRLERARLASRLDIAPVSLTEGEISELVAFLRALTGTGSLEGRLGRPKAVPSGLEVD